MTLIENNGIENCTYKQGHEGPHSYSHKLAGTNPVTPTYYQGDYVMQIIEDFKLDFLRGTVVKYLLRAGNKTADTELVDLEKARWYLDRKIQQLKKEK